MKTNIILGLALLTVAPIFSQNTETTEAEQPKDSISQLNTLQEVSVSSIRVNTDSPITFTNIDKKTIQKVNLGQDIPRLISFTPSIVQTSDAGAGIGYSSVRIRGVDGTRVNVTINGVPYNDPESQGTFWVNLQDFASSVGHIQIQRGVGTSTNGAAAFGASINMTTDKINEEPLVHFSNSIGSFDTRKHTLKFSTGLRKGFELSGRLSNLYSNGYVDRASTDMKSYFLQGAYYKNKTILKILSFGGKERTYQAWYGIDEETLKTNRTYNPAGAYTDSQGKTQFYPNQVDNYEQYHLQAIWQQEYNDYFQSSISGHFTRGYGYYEEYNASQPLKDYGISPITQNAKTINTSDLITKKWLSNDFYGVIWSLKYDKDHLKVILGGGLNDYKGDHYGVVTAFKQPIQRDTYHPYYDNYGNKTDFNIYNKWTWTQNQWKFFVDLQYRTVAYNASFSPTQTTTNKLDFFNPKIGTTWIMSNASKLYLSYAIANKEPNRTDYENIVKPKPETLHDVELGWRLVKEKYQLNTNIYWMRYDNQLVLTGELNDVGSALRQNVGKSYRLGLEIESNINISNKIKWSPYITISDNKNIDYKSTGTTAKVTALGNTNISFSPNVIAGSNISYTPIENLELALASKYVGEQYMSNDNVEASKLKDYFISNLNINYKWLPSKIFKEIVFSGLINNIFDEKYVNNGYYSSGYVGYYPQAGINFLTGISLHF